MFDHWGGLNTMFHIISNAGTLVITKERTPEEICKLIESHEVELLPASPTFLNLLILSQLNKKYEVKKATKKGKGIHIDGQTSGKNPDTLVTTVIEGNETHIIRQVDGNNIYLVLNNTNGYSININQGGVEVPEIRTDEAGFNSTIFISQRQ